MCIYLLFTLVNFLTKSKRMRKEKNRPLPRPAGLRSGLRSGVPANTQVRSRSQVTGFQKNHRSGQVSGQGVPET